MVSYDEALDSLVSMFGGEGSQWTRQALDQVLRHHEGHVENTIETVLANIDNDPQDLIRRLKDPSIVAERIDADEELAKQLSQKGGITESAPQNKAKNTTSDTASEAKISDAEFTLPRAKLPSDFLRIPGYKHRSTPSDANLSDEQLAWMLQDKDLENHLKQREVAQRLERMSARSSQGYPGSRSSKEGEGPNIMKHLSQMGQEAKEKFTNFASQINSNMKQVDKNVRENTNERRSLLDSNDDVEEELLFAISSDRSNEMEMRAIGSKKHD